MLTIEKIKEKYGNSRGYVVCDDCPCLNTLGCPNEHQKRCDGFDDAYKAIQNYLDTDDLPSTLFSPYEINIIDLMQRQHDKGLDKYGETLEDNVTLTIEQRIEHLQEELIDGLEYCEHLKAAYKDHMTANDYQRAALRTASPECHSLGNVGLGLSGEAGECTDLIKKHLYHGHELDKESLKKELGDVLWYVAVGADVIGCTLEDIMQLNIDKLKKRYPDGFDKARSINREA